MSHAGTRSCSSADMTHRMSVSVAAAFVRKSSLQLVNGAVTQSMSLTVKEQTSAIGMPSTCMHFSEVEVPICCENTPQLCSCALELILLLRGFLHLLA